MCGRYTLHFPIEILAEIFGLSDLPGLVPRYNIAPTQTVGVVRSTGSALRLDLLRWGLVPSWAKDISIGSRMINARSESLRINRHFEMPSGPGDVLFRLPAFTNGNLKASVKSLIIFACQMVRQWG